MNGTMLSFTVHLGKSFASYSRPFPPLASASGCPSLPSPAQACLILQQPVWPHPPQPVSSHQYHFPGSRPHSLSSFCWGEPASGCPGLDHAWAHILGTTHGQTLLAPSLVCLLFAGPESSYTLSSRMGNYHRLMHGAFLPSPSE